MPRGIVAPISISFLAVFEALALTATGCSPARGDGAGNPKAALEPASTREHGLEKGAVVVRVVPLSNAPVVRPLTVAGTLRTHSELNLAFKVGGILEHLSVERGSRVRRGQVLAELNSTELEAAARQASEALAKAERDFARAEALRHTDSLPEATFEDARTAREVAAAVQSSAAYSFSRRLLVAPQDGIVEAKLADVGEVLAPGRPVLHLRGLSRGWVVRAAVVDRDAVRIGVGAPVRVAMDALEDTVFTGHVTERAPAATAGIGTFEVEVGLSLPKEGGNGLLAGLPAKVTFSLDEPGLRWIPPAALVEGEGQRGKVYIPITPAAPDGTMAVRSLPVRVAFVAADRLAVEGNFEGTSHIVAEGSALLSAESRVRAFEGGAP